MSIEAAAGADMTLLIEWERRDGAAIEAEAVRAAASDLQAQLPGIAFDGVCEEIEGPLVTVYFSCRAADVRLSALQAFADRNLAPVAPGAPVVRRLSRRLAVAGAAAGQDAPFRYVVHTDVASGGAEELERWYDAEHMPGLAAVPGTVFAQRMICLDDGPLYFACYDLVAPEVLGSPAWLAVRATAWSDRVRPTFRNTRRFMSRRLIGA